MANPFDVFDAAQPQRKLPPASPIGPFPGMLQQGNIDLEHRPVVNNPDGSYSTVRSMSFGNDSGEVLVPTVSPDGKVLPDRDAMDLYGKTKQTLGVFDTPEHADMYAGALHKAQEQHYGAAQPQAGANPFDQFDTPDVQAAPPPQVPGGDFVQPLPEGTVNPPGSVPAGTPDKSMEYMGQKVARVPADLIGAIPDLINMYANSAINYADNSYKFAYGPDHGLTDYRIPSMSDRIADVSGNIFEGAGGKLVKPEEVDASTRANAEAARFGIGALVPGGILAKIGKAGELTQAPNVVRRFVEPLAATYKTDNPMRTVVGDAIGGAGAGYGGQSYEDMVPDEWKEKIGPIGKVLASILGGVGANTVDAIGSGLTSAGITAGKNMVTGKRDFAVPVNPETGLRPRRTDVEEAARVAQAMPTDKARTITNIDQGAENFGQMVKPNEMPTTGMLADDVGMATNENVARGRNAQAFVERDTAREAAAARKLDSVTPAGDGRAFTDTATRLHDEAIGNAEKQVLTAEQAQAAAKQDITRQNVELEAARANQPQASVALASEFDNARNAARETKNAIYDAVDPKTPIENGGAHLGEAIKRIDAQMSNAEKLAGGPYANIAGRVKQLVAGGKPITYGDVKALKAQISEARKMAVTASGQSVAGSGADAQRLKDLGTVVGTLANQTNPEASQHYANVYAPKFKEGKAGEYGAQIDRAVRTGGESSATRPSEFGAKFLNKPEDAASLKRALTPKPTGQAALPGEGGRSSGMFPQSEQNAHDWMLGDLAKSGVLTDNAEIRYDRFKRWTDKNRATIDQFPTLADRIDKELAGAQKGGFISKQLADDVLSAKGNLNQTKREMSRSALSAAINNDPEHAVGKLMGSGDSEKQMAEMVRRLQGDKSALDGLKTATRDWIVQRKGDGKAIVGHGDLRHVNAKGMQDLFNQHEKTLAKLYTPEEMNTLRQVHALATAPKKLDVKSLPGSDTFSRIMNDAAKESGKTGKMREAALKLWFGMLRGGGINRGINLALETLPNNKNEVSRILDSIWFDPEVAGHLLKMPLRDRDVPLWNGKLNRLLSASSGGRDQQDDK
ncbi:hypothetical protein [Mesorhizobium sp. M0139]|uniref:hypothetical protein n=1 Tax=Mesorhizobium sp. M0139 TaxID=2956892 RepID=UPI00333CE678